MVPGGRLERRVRPASFYACMTCEFCSEDLNDAQF